MRFSKKRSMETIKEVMLGTCQKQVALALQQVMQDQINRRSHRKLHDGVQALSMGLSNDEQSPG